MELRYVDSHCHLGDYLHPHQTALEAMDEGVVVVAVTSLPSEYRRLSAGLGKMKNIRFSLGAHPLKATRFNQLEQRIFQRALRDVNYIGEVGLDYSGEAKEYVEQRRVFTWLLELPDIRDKILSVHTRGAERDAIASLVSANVTAALHWYTGPLALVDEALEGGLYFSVNGSMLRTSKGRNLLENLPRHRVITETDGPYARRGRKAPHPQDIHSTVSILSSLWDVHADEARSQVWANMLSLFDSGRS